MAEVRIAHRGPVSLANKLVSVTSELVARIRKRKLKNCEQNLRA